MAFSPAQPYASSRFRLGGLAPQRRNLSGSVSTTRGELRVIVRAPEQGPLKHFLQLLRPRPGYQTAAIDGLHIHC